MISRLHILYRILVDSKFRSTYFLQRRLRSFPRYKATHVKLFGKKIQIPDSASFLSQLNEIFDKEIYVFNSNKSDPLIIDCGSNIGLSIMYFKKKFPKSKIVGFEPDHSVFKFLKHNLEVFNYTDVELFEKAVWTSNENLSFTSEGADGGRISGLTGEKENSSISAIRLKDFLKNKKVDLLKLDIEGAETEVLLDCSEELIHVERIFVEYHSFLSKKQNLHVLLKVLSDAGFRIHIQPEMYSKQPFIQINSYLNIDMQFNIFAFRQPLVNT